MAPNKVRPPTTHLLTSHWQQLHSAPKRHFLSSHQRKDLKRGCACDSSELHCSIDWIQWNLLLTAAILWIVTIFACVRQLSAFSESTTRQWPHFTLLQDYQHNEMHCYGFQSTLHVLNELVIKPPAELHTVCGFKPDTVVLDNVHSWVCWVTLFNHWVHCKHPVSQRNCVLRRWIFSNWWKRGN